MANRVRKTRPWRQYSEAVTSHRFAIIDLFTYSHREERNISVARLRAAEMSFARAREQIELRYRRIKACCCLDWLTPSLANSAGVIAQPELSVSHLFVSADMAISHAPSVLRLCCISFRWETWPG